MISPTNDANLVYEMELNIFKDDCWTYGQIESSLNVGEVYIIPNVGYVIYKDLDHEIEILRIGIEKQYRRQGYGGDLIDQLKSETSRIILEVSEDNKKALKFYYDCLFREDGIRRNYYKDGSDAILLSWDK